MKITKIVAKRLRVGRGARAWQSKADTANKFEACEESPWHGKQVRVVSEAPQEGRRGIVKGASVYKEYTWLTSLKNTKCAFNYYYITVSVYFF